MKPKENKTYVFVYMKETDGDMLIETLTSEKIKEKIERLHLDHSDYAIIEGNILKSFNSKSFDFNSL